VTVDPRYPGIVAGDPLAAILPGGLGAAPVFGPTSRYSGLPLLTVEVHGKPVRCVSRRFLPSPADFALLTEHVVEEGERPDTLAASVLGDPMAFWRLCDANNVLRPQELTEEVGRPVRITLPAGIPGAPSE
jgi:hypothetical protein